MRLQKLSPAFAQRLLDTFNKPVSAKSQNYDLDGLKGGFISNWDYFNNPHCSAAYYGQGDEQEFYVEWNGFDDVDSVLMLAREGYAFQSIDEAKNYLDCIRIVKNHLKDIIQGEL